MQSLKICSSLCSPTLASLDNVISRMSDMTTRLAARGDLDKVYELTPHIAFLAIKGEL